VDVFLIIALVAALFGGGYAYAQGEPDMLTGILAITGIVCLLCMVITPFLLRASAPPSRYKVTPLSRNPLSNLAVRWNLFMLKWRYRRRRDH
jgi:NADH:ubiquinone oxidoreductase subunit H